MDRDPQLEDATTADSRRREASNIHAPHATAAECLAEGVRLENAGSLAAADALFRAVPEREGGAELAARALLRRAHVHRCWGVWEEAVRLAQSGRALARRLGEIDLEAELLNAEGAVHQARGALDEAEALFTGMLGIARDPRVRGVALQNLGATAALRRDFDQAERYFARSRRCFGRAGYRRGEAFALNNQGRVRLDQGRARAAREPLEEALCVATEVGDGELRALATMNLAEAHLGGGAPQDAALCVEAALAYFTASENPWRAVECLRIQGDVALAGGEVEEARRVWTRALDLAETLRAQVEIAELRGRLGRLEPGPPPGR